MATTRARGPQRKYHHGDLRRALIDAALALIAEGELGTLSLREVARRAGVTAAAPYHHFRDKTALLAAVAEEGFVALGARMDAALDALPASDARGRLAALGHAYLAFARAHRAHYRVMFLPDVKNHADFPELHAAADHTFVLLAAAVQAASPEAEAQTLTARAVITWATTHGLASLWNDGLLDAKPDLRVDRTFFHDAIEHVVTLATGRPAPKPAKRRGRG